METIGGNLGPSEVTTAGPFRGGEDGRAMLNEAKTNVVSLLCRALVSGRHALALSYSFNCSACCFTRDSDNK